MYVRPHTMSSGGTDDGDALLRVAAVIIAVPAVELALFIAVYAISGRWRVFQVLTGVPGWFHPLLIGVTAIAAYFVGIRGLTSVYHHLFYRHASDKRSPIVTGSLWCGLLLLAGLARELSQ